MFNIRQDPYQSCNQAPGPRATLSQQKTYLFNDVFDRLGRQPATLQQSPPKQKGSSLSIGNEGRIVEAISALCSGGSAAAGVLDVKEKLLKRYLLGLDGRPLQQESSFIF